MWGTVKDTATWVKTVAVSATQELYKSRKLVKWQVKWSRYMSLSDKNR